eukprot:gene10918-12916_t
MAAMVSPSIRVSFVKARNSGYSTNKRAPKSSFKCVAIYADEEAVDRAHPPPRPYWKEVKNNVARTQKLRLITAIKTPYLWDGRFDLLEYDKLVETQIECGVEGVIVGGTTGEGHLMSWDEHIMLIAHTAKNYGDSLQINPYYGKTSLTGLQAHFNAVLDEGPAIIYNVPGRTGQDIPNEIVEKCAEHSNFVGVKECTGNDRIKYYTDQGITCWSGNDDEAFEARHKAGAQGVISVTSNIIPSLFRLLMDEEDVEKAKKCEELIEWLFQAPNPIGLNTMLMMGGRAKPVFRLPYVQYPEEQRKEGARILEEIGLEYTIFDEVRVMEDDDFLWRSSF